VLCYEVTRWTRT